MSIETTKFTVDHKDQFAYKLWGRTHSRSVWSMNLVEVSWVEVKIENSENEDSCGGKLDKRFRWESVNIESCCYEI